MRRSKTPISPSKRRAHVLAGIIILQALCALFFSGDVVSDIFGSHDLDDPHLILETLAAVALTGGVIFLMVELRRLLVRLSDLDLGLRAAQGQMAEVMESFYEEWSLTGAEREVATMILKGFENDAIAKMRNTASGTVRAQATSIYAKSGSAGRAQFVSLFMEELMSGDFTDIGKTQAAAPQLASANT